MKIFNTNKNPGSKFTEDWLPVKQIMNGMIQLDTGEIVTGVKVHPKNIFIMEQGAQHSMINRLQNFYNTFDYEFWLLIADRPVDIGVYLSHLQIMYRNEISPARKNIILQDINKGNLFMSNEYSVVDTEYFLLFKEKKMELIQKKLHNIMSGLATSGLQSTQTSNDDLRMILDNFLNDGDKSTVGTVM